MPLLITLLIIFVAAILIVIGPILIIWSLNTLFGMGIPITIWTWLSVVILGSVFKAKITINK